MQYQYNGTAHYAPYAKHAELITGKDLTQFDIVVQDNNEKSSFFRVKFSDGVFDLGVYKYYKHGDFYMTSGGYQTAKSAYNFAHNPMGLWETQLNFAVHCASSGLGISTEHLNAKEPMVKALYRFHVYYHIRRILRRILAPIPNEDGFDKYNNAFSKEQVQRIGNEYGISTKNLAIYKNQYYFERTGTSRSGYDYEHNNWSRWIINSSHGFTKHGLEKISESIRAYTYLILTSQVGARHTIVGNEARSLTAQRLFFDNLEDAINKTVSLEDDVKRYQNVLKYARSSLDYSVGERLYMLPSDMLLKPLNQVIEGYNDKIVVNTDGFDLGKHVVFTKPKPVLTIHQPKILQKQHPRILQKDHEDEKQALIWGLGGLMLFVIWWIH